MKHEIQQLKKKLFAAQMSVGMRTQTLKIL